METNEVGAPSVLPRVPPPLQRPEYYQQLAREALAQLAMLSAHPTVFDNHVQLKQKYDLLFTKHQQL